MDTIKYEKRKTLTIAHRGLSGIETENTVVAFSAAAKKSYFGIETDVHITKDGKFVIIHDNETGRVCSENISVENSNSDTLFSLILNDINSKKPRSDLKIPTLKEYIEICKKFDKIAVLELKNPMKREKVFEIAQEIISENYLEKTIIISFDFNNLIYFREKCPSASVQYLLNDYNGAMIEILSTYKFDVDIEYKCLTKERIDEIHNHNLKVNCWTVNKKDEAELLTYWGVDFITSNILE